MRGSRRIAGPAPSLGQRALRSAESEAAGRTAPALERTPDALVATGGLDLLDARHPELLLLLMGCAVVAELTPLKVVLRAAEGEITACLTATVA